MTTNYRKIDALVAEHVMQLPVGYMSEQDVVPFIIVDQATASFDEIPHYSTDIAAAWSVVEKLCDEMLPENKRFSVSVGTNWCEFERRVYQGEPDVFVVTADTAPLAVSLAALKLKGIEV